MATMTGKDEQLETKDIRINGLENKATVLSEELDHAIALGKKGIDDVNRLEVDLAQRCDKLNRAISLNTERQMEIESLLQSRSGLTATNESLRLKVCHQSIQN